MIRNSKTWQRFRDWYGARTRREQVLFALALVALPALLWSVLIDPAMRATGDALRAQIDEHETRLEELRAEREALVARAESDPNAELRATISEREQELEALETSVAKQVRGFVGPREMVQVLRRLIAADQQLRLENLETAAPEPVFEEEGLRVYRHGVSVRFTGHYAATREYLERLEERSRDLGWDRIDYEVGTHPAATIHLRVHTLSLEEPTLGL